jgi:hypothetical protein
MDIAFIFNQDQLICPWCRSDTDDDGIRWTIPALKRHVKRCPQAPRPRGGRKGDVAMNDKAKETAAAPPRKVEYDEFSGDTENVLVPSLAADFWREGRLISGVLEGYREVQFTDRKTGAKRMGNAYRIKLATPVSIGGEEVEIVEMPPLTGFTAALKDVKQQHQNYTPKIGDSITIECSGIRKATQPDFSDSPNFRIKFRRPRF